MADLSCVVDLGFVETVEPWKLLSHFFPSKVGGKPAWLAFDNLPKADQLRCGSCGKICVYLMQLYAPADQLNISAFHRTLFVFICKDPKCSVPNRTDNFIVFRSQLAKQNSFYSHLPPNEDDFDVNSCDYPKASDYQTLCAVCGCPGHWKCGKCKQVSYCDKTHQAADWKAGHKQSCGKENTGSTYDTGLLFKEFSLEMEPEEDDEDEAECVEKDKADEMGEYEKIAETLKTKEKAQLSAEELEQIAGKSYEDKKFLEFQRIIAKNPQQVVRYQRNGQPLWVTDFHIPQPSDIPPCDFCHSSRQFEFQVMPTLLPHIVEDAVNSSIDWGTLIIYSCSRSCNEGGSYGKEFIWKQDFVN